MPRRTTIGRWLRRFLWGVAVLVLLAAVAVGAVWWYLHPAVERTNGIVYGQRHGRPLTLDILRPRHPNGLGVITVVSGSWKSGPPGSLGTWIVAPLIRRGYTVFAACHVSQPEASVPEIIEDIHRAVRFVRHHSREYGVDPDRLGITGGSAGGHLSLMIATRGGPGPADALDPVDRASSAVQAVAVFFPVTDLLHLGRSTENAGDGGPPRSYRNCFG
ncbi:MAG: alpha/beta hydrolase, partial [Verrucomicrobia bacterium]